MHNSTYRSGVTSCLHNGLRYERRCRAILLGKVPLRHALDLIASYLGVAIGSGKKFPIVAKEHFIGSDGVSLAVDSLHLAAELCNSYVFCLLQFLFRNATALQSFQFLIEKLLDFRDIHVPFGLNCKLEECRVERPIPSTAHAKGNLL